MNGDFIQNYFTDFVLRQVVSFYSLSQDIQKVLSSTRTFADNIKTENNKEVHQYKDQQSHTEATLETSMYQI
jgi:hypothetical protein